MVGPRDRGPFGIGLSKEVSLGVGSPRGPSARVPIRLQYPVFKVPGGVFRSRRRPPSRAAARRCILPALPGGVKGRLFAPLFLHNYRKVRFMLLTD